MPPSGKSLFWQKVTIVERKRMRKLALSDEILMKVDKAARYIGHDDPLQHVQPA